MKRIVSLLCITMCLAMGVFAFVGCGNKGAVGGKIVESLTVTNKTILVAENTTNNITITARIKYVGENERAATSEDVEFITDNAQVATVSDKGVVTVNGVGSTVITVKSKSGGATGEKLMETIDLTVVRSSSVVENLTITGGTEQTATYKVDTTLQLETKIKYVGETEKTATNADVMYTSSEPSVASVTSGGLVSIKAVGTTEITVSSIYNNVGGAKIVKVITLNVKEPPLITETIMLTSASKYSVYRGIYEYDPEKGYENDKTQITFDAKYYYEDEERAGKSDEATYASSNESIASVSDSGEITFNAIGTCIITVTSKYKTMDGEILKINIPVEVKRPEPISSEFEIASWRVSENVGWDGLPFVFITINNLTDKEISCYGDFDVYCLDEQDNILGYLKFYDAYFRRKPYAQSELLQSALGTVPEETVKMIILDIKDMWGSIYE